MKKFLVLLSFLASVVAGFVLTAGPAEAADSTILFSNSNYNSSSFDCYVKNSSGGKVYKVNDGQDRKVSNKGYVKCDGEWYARTFGTGRTSKPLKKNQWYRIGGQYVPLAWIVAESKQVAGT